jgi:hypothetical protein
VTFYEHINSIIKEVLLLFRSAFSASGKLSVNSFPYPYSIAEGDILNHDPLLKFGTRSSVSSGTTSAGSTFELWYEDV